MSNESKGRQEETLASGGRGGKEEMKVEFGELASNTLRSRDFEMMKGWL